LILDFISKHPDRAAIIATIEDAPHFSEQDRARIIASYPSWELEARTKGIPSLGSGRVYPVPEELIACEHFDIPRHFPRIGGMDFGFTSTFAAVELAWDRDADCVYVTREYKVSQQTPILHAAALRPWGKDLLWSWPRDGRRETLEGAGIPLARQYKEQGLELLSEHSQFEDGGVSVEAGLMLALDRMQTGRLKVFKHLNQFWSEFRLYHRRDGRVVKEDDHLLDAMRYALMSLRFARTTNDYDAFRQPIKYKTAKRYV
jgi:Terminase RNaseH-like domain